MEQIRELIFAVCMCAVLNSGVRLLSPEKLQKEMRIICTLMLIICAAAKLSGGFKINVGELISKESERQAGYSESVIAETEKSLNAALTKKLSEAGIENAETGIHCVLDEYNLVKAEKVYIHLHGGESERTAALRA